MVPSATALLILALVAAMVGSTDVAWRAAYVAVAFYGLAFAVFLVGQLAGRRVHV